MRIRIKEHQKNILDITTDPSISIYEIKDKIKEATSYPIKVQHLFYKHQELTDGHYIKDYNINKDIILNLVILQF